MTTVAVRYGVSANYLARVCTWLEVTRPGRDHWARVRAGERIRRSALPPRRAGGPRASLLDGSDDRFRDAIESDVGYLRPKKRAMADLLVTPGTQARVLRAAGRLYGVLESRGQLLSIVEAWGLARQVESCREIAAERVDVLDRYEERSRALERLREARGMFGGTDALEYFAAWRSPAERVG